MYVSCCPFFIPTCCSKLKSVDVVSLTWPAVHAEKKVTIRLHAIQVVAGSHVDSVERLDIIGGPVAAQVQAQ